MGRSKSGGPISKRKMVEMAVTELGNAGPKEMHAHILKQHGADLTLQMISSYKSNLKKASGVGGSRSAIADGSIGIKDLLILQDLVARVGAAQIQSVVKALNK